VKKKKSVKVIVTTISIVVHIMLAVLAIIFQFNGVFFATWFASFNATIAIFTTGNVMQKKIISQNYRPELDDKNRSIDGCA